MRRHQEQRQNAQAQSKNVEHALGRQQLATLDAQFNTQRQQHRKQFPKWQCDVTSLIQRYALDSSKWLHFRHFVGQPASLELDATTTLGNLNVRLEIFESAKATMTCRVEGNDVSTMLGASAMNSLPSYKRSSAFCFIQQRISPRPKRLCLGRRFKLMLQRAMTTTYGAIPFTGFAKGSLQKHSNALLAGSRKQCHILLCVRQVGRGIRSPRLSLPTMRTSMSSTCRKLRGVENIFCRRCFRGTLGGASCSA